VASRFDNSQAIKELARDSEFKQMAYEQGMIRPFLLLASMHPKRRAIWVTVPILSFSLYVPSYSSGCSILRSLCAPPLTLFFRPY
jgi:hypothetical protein